MPFKITPLGEALNDLRQADGKVEYDAMVKVLVDHGVYHVDKKDYGQGEKGSDSGAEVGASKPTEKPVKAKKSKTAKPVKAKKSKKA